MRCCVVTVAAALWFGFVTKQLDLGWVYDNYLPLMTAAILFSISLSAFVYLASFSTNRLLSTGGQTG